MRTFQPVVLCLLVTVLIIPSTVLSRKTSKTPVLGSAKKQSAHKIQYTIRGRTHVSLRVYNVAGQVVATLVEDSKTPGPHTVTWNGKSNAGDPLSSGVYF